MTIVEVPDLPSAVGLNLGVLCASLKASRNIGLQDVIFARPDVIVDKKRVMRYSKICGYDQNRGVPPLFPHIEAFPLALMIFKSQYFPYRAMGMIHLANSATLHKRIVIGDRLRIEVQTGELLAHERGQVVTMTARALRDGVLVWSSSWSFLRSGVSNPVGSPYTSGLKEVLDLSRHADFYSKLSSTLRYAFVSGDVNPIHMSHLGAKVLGFRRALAHGMWTKARVLSLLMPYSEVNSCDVSVEFYSPLYLPAQPTLWVKRDDSGHCFEVRSVDGEKLHLRGKFNLPIE